MPLCHEPPGEILSLSDVCDVILQVGNGWMNGEQSIVNTDFFMFNSSSYNSSRVYFCSSTVFTAYFYGITL